MFTSASEYLVPRSVPHKNVIELGRLLKCLNDIDGSDYHLRENGYIIIEKHILGVNCCFWNKMSGRQTHDDV